MWRLIRSSTAAVLLAVTLASGWAWAESEGQEDLDRATEAKLTAKTSADLAEVIRLLESALEKGLDEENAEFAKNLLASVLIERGSAVARMAFQGSPRHPKFSDRCKAALADLEKGVRLSPRQPQALYDIARISLLASGDVQRATEALQQAIGLLEDEPGFRAKALTLRASIEKDPEKKMADLDEAVRIAPGDAAARRTRGLLHADMGKPEQSLADLDKAIELDPKHGQTYEAKAVVLARLKKYDEALVSLDRARELSPDSPAPLLQKARIHTMQSNLDAALHELNQAHSIDPDNVVVLILRAGLYQELGEEEKALADADKVLELRPELPAAMRLRASLLAAADKMDEAFAELERLLKLHPKDVSALMQLGMFSIAEKKHQRAVDAYSALLAEHPDHWIALRGRGDALLNLGRHQQAIADYEKAIKLQPKDPGLLNNLAWVLATSPEEKLRDGKRAVALATEACELTGHKLAHILSTLAAAYAETGDFEAAVKWSEKAVEIGGEDQLEALKKELESHRAGKPWRELLCSEENEKPETEEKE